MLLASILENIKDLTVKYLTIIFVSLFLFGCNPFVEKTDLEFSVKPGPRSGKASKVDFNEITKKIIMPHCIKCHSSYMSYSTVFSKRKSILRSVISNRMPKKAVPLSTDLKNLLKDWIDSGAIRSNQNSNEPSVSKAPTGLSKRMQELYKEHLNVQPVLDDEVPMNLSKEGKTFEYNMTEGRVAQLQYGFSKQYKFVARIDFIENTCGNFKPKACLFVSHGKSAMKRLAWIKNNDASRLNKIVQINQADVESGEEDRYEDVFDEELLGSGMGLIYPNIDQKVKDYIICDDWNWIKKDEMNIQSWGIERMQENSETGMNENRVIGGMYNFNMKKHNKEIYRLDAPEFIDSQFGRSTLVSVIGEAGSMFYEDGNRQCMVGFKFDVNALIASYRMQQQTQEDVKFSAYHKDQDQTFYENGKANINDLLDSITNTELEAR
jgi:hypothetical protein